MMQLIARFCRWQAHRHGDLAWNPCSNGIHCCYNEQLHPSDCRRRNRAADRHARLRWKWWARYDAIMALTKPFDKA